MKDMSWALFLTAGTIFFIVMQVWVMSIAIDISEIKKYLNRMELKCLTTSIS